MRSLVIKLEINVNREHILRLLTRNMVETARQNI